MYFQNVLPHKTTAKEAAGNTPLIQPDLNVPEVNQDSLRNIKAQERATNTHCGHHYAPFGSVAFGSLSRALAYNPLKCLGQHLTHTCWYQQNRTFKLICLPASIVGFIANGLGNTINGSIKLTLGLCAIGYSVAAKKIQMYKGDTPEQRMVQQPLSKDVAKVYQKDSELLLEELYLHVGAIEKPKLPDGYEFATIEDIPRKWQHAYNPDSGFLQPDLYTANHLLVLKDTVENKIKLFFGGIHGPSGMGSAVTASVFTDEHILTGNDIVKCFADLHDKEHIKLAGHSLGGQIVEYAGAMQQIDTVAFNSAGLSPLSRMEIGQKRIRTANITNINTCHDYLSQGILREKGVDLSTKYTRAHIPVPRVQIGTLQYKMNAIYGYTHELTYDEIGDTTQEEATGSADGKEINNTMFAHMLECVVDSISEIAEERCNLLSKHQLED
ncbi:hypothetical protein JQC92_21410 [Shewanella sp. 202IG2-18]|uniref:hypothetical protein n=1 Tax=Parashewanella hymeniacidonis TaxID=2807618 RepID=UPI001961B72D|nr:hypothetical protein [Parashewanella hymeniacidonis]MBM7074543.1 hypothetical protein [Parashewanella hymeniacidonis]